MALMLICIVFVLGYLCIALEHPLHINKAASALATGVVCWTVYALFASSLVPANSIPLWFVDSLGQTGHDPSKLAIEYLVEGQLHKALAEIAGILFFLLGAMTIVELVDAFEGFRLITSRINSKSKVKLMWIVAFVTFFMSAVLDNLTTTIVMISLLRKLVNDRQTRMLFAGLVVIAANAGGAWTVIGDVTTTMLWMKKKISTFEVMIRLIFPSLVCLVVPLTILSCLLSGEVERPESEEEIIEKEISPVQQRSMLMLGLGGLLSVPIFKLVTHLPPFMGMLLSLSIVWSVSELIRKRINHEYTRSTTHVLEILKKVDSSSILFFLGILLAVSCLSYTGLLAMAANFLNNNIGNQTVVAVLIGLISAVVDNVPLVAAGIEMYQYETDNAFWHLLAYCAGTGGSCLIIGSAAGVAAMGLERIDFLWYLRRIAPLALIGYLSGVGVYVVIEGFLKRSSTAQPVAVNEPQSLGQQLVSTYASSNKLDLHWELGPTGSQASFRGISSPTASTVWLCGSQSTVLRSTDAGDSWLNCSPSWESLEFRSIVAHSETQACIASAGTPAIILKTFDSGKTWREVYRHDSPSAFFDGMKFWNARQGIAFSDPVDGKFLIVETEDGGDTWRQLDPATLPEVMEGEAAFAASNSSLLTGAGGQVWIGTGGSPRDSSRIHYRPAWQAAWQLQSAPIPSNKTSGVFSLAQSPIKSADARAPLIVAVGGDYRADAHSPVVCVLSYDGGQKWQSAKLPPKQFRSAVIAVHSQIPESVLWVTVGPSGSDYSTDGEEWYEFSSHGFHALSNFDNQIFAAGSNGKFAKLKVK